MEARREVELAKTKAEAKAEAATKAEAKAAETRARFQIEQVKSQGKNFWLCPSVGIPSLLVFIKVDLNLEVLLRRTDK